MLDRREGAGRMRVYRRARRLMRDWLYPDAVATPLDSAQTARSFVTVQQDAGQPSDEPGGAAAAVQSSATTAASPDVLLDDGRWLGLVEECVELYDDLDAQRRTSEPALRELVDHVCTELEELLQRSGVELISGDTAFDRNQHQPEPARAGAVRGSVVVETISPGFRVGRRVLRRAHVRLDELPKEVPHK